MVRVCEKCGRTIREECACFCPFCGVKLESASLTDGTGLPTAAGTLSILASLACLIVTWTGLGTYALQTYPYAYSYYGGLHYEWLIVGIVAVFGFACGVTAGVASLTRRYYSMSIIGDIIILISGLATIKGLYGDPHGYFVAAIFAPPILVMPILSIAFAAMSKNEFLHTETK